MSLSLTTNQKHQRVDDSKRSLELFQHNPREYYSPVQVTQFEKISLKFIDFF